MSVHDDKCWYESGPYGHGALIEAGRVLMSFPSINMATICEPSFVKKSIHKQTSQHQVQAHSRRCLDIFPMHGSQCNSTIHVVGGEVGTWEKVR